MRSSLVALAAVAASAAIHPDLDFIDYAGEAQVGFDQPPSTLTLPHLLTDPPAAQFTLFKFPQATYPNAVCLDGTQGGVYFQPGFGADAVCSSQISCSPPVPTAPPTRASIRTSG